jgi:hypothetical protein
MGHFGLTGVYNGRRGGPVSTQLAVSRYLLHIAEFLKPLLNFLYNVTKFLFFDCYVLG